MFIEDFFQCCTFFKVTDTPTHTNIDVQRFIDYGPPGGAIKKLINKSNIINGDYFNYYALKN